MTKDEIKEAVELCTYVYAPCNGCPYETCTNCDATLHTDALKLIAEQEREIEKLKADLEHQIDVTNDAENLADHLKYDLDKVRKQAQIDVLNELKEKCKFDGHTVAVYKNDIEEMIKELKK